MILKLLARLPHSHTHIEIDGVRYDTTPVPWWFKLGWRLLHQ
jgi:hypothetical protein